MLIFFILLVDKFCALMILRIFHPRTFIYDCPKKAKGMLRTYNKELPLIFSDSFSETM